MSHRITVSDEAYDIIRRHCMEYQERHQEAVDELCAVRDAAWKPTKFNPGAGRVFELVE